MSDPRRLLDEASDVERRLIEAGLAEPDPPADLLDRTLTAVSAAGAAATATTAASAAAKGAVAGAKVAGGGILGAVGVGTLAGILVIGAYEITTPARVDPKPAPPAPAIVHVVDIPHPKEVAAPAPPPSVTASSAPIAPPVAPASGSAAPSTLAAELLLLDEARAALRAGDPARALAVLDRYAREIPRGQLAREAAVVRAEATAARDAGP